MTRKTTVYLPEALKADLEREARRRRCSEAEVIRAAVAAAVARPHPRHGIVDAPAIAEHAEELLGGFGER